MYEILPLLSLAFISGLGTSFQPCLFPLLPTYFSYMNSYKKGKISIQEGILVSIFLTLGILVVFLTLALLVKIGFLGISSFLLSHVPEFNFLMSIILIIFGILMIIGYEFTFFYRVPGFSSFLISQNPENNLIASFSLGLAYTLIATPCAAPIFLSLIFQVIFLDPFTIILLMVIYAIGCGIPFLVIGILYPNFGKEIRAQYGGLVKYIKPFSGVILLLMAFYLLNNFVLPYYIFTLFGFTFTAFSSDLLSTIYIDLFIIGIVCLGILIIFLKYNKKERIPEQPPLE